MSIDDMTLVGIVGVLRTVIAHSITSGTWATTAIAMVGPGPRLKTLSDL
jgi:hypothetical protein